MKDGFVKAAAATPDIRVADVAYNTENICKMIDETVANGAKVIVFPELCVDVYKRQKQRMATVWYWTRRYSSRKAAVSMQIQEFWEL